MAFCIPAVGESYDCAKAAISLERSNSFPWPKDCVQIHQTLFPRRARGWGLGTRLVKINQNVILALYTKKNLNVMLGATIRVAL